MTTHRSERLGFLSRFAVLVGALSAAGCYGGDCDDCAPYYPPPSGPDVPRCESGVTEGSVDADVFLDLEPGEGVGATVEYASDGSWRFAVTCDSLESNAGCAWSLLVAPLDGTIDDFAPEDLEDEDLVMRYPSMVGSLEEDGVSLESLTDDDDVDAFTVFATPGAGMFVSALLDERCGGPFLFWTEGGEVRNSTTEATELFPE